MARAQPRAYAAEALYAVEREVLERLFKGGPQLARELAHRLGRPLPAVVGALSTLRGRALVRGAGTPRTWSLELQASELLALGARLGMTPLPRPR